MLVVRHLAIVIVLVFGLFLTASGQQQSKKDSLKSILKIETNYLNIIKTLHTSARVQMYEDPEEALAFADQAKLIAENIDDKESIIASLDLIGSIHRLTGDLDKAEGTFLLTLEFSQQNGNKAGASIAYNNLGELFEIKEDYNDALGFYLQSLGAAEEANDLHKIAVANTYIGNVYLLMKNYKRSMDYAKNALHIYQQSENKAEMGICLKTLGLLYARKNDNHTALDYLERSLRRFENDESLLEQAQVKYEIGLILHDLGSYERALKYLNESLQIAEKIGMEREYMIKGYVKLINSIGESEARKEVQLQRERIITYVLIGGISLVTLLLIFIYWQFRQKNQANARISKAKDQAIRSENEKERFLAYTSHEIRTPLNAVVGTTQLLTKTPLTLDQEKYLNTIQASSEHILTIVNDILDLSKIESGKVEFESIDFMMSELVGEIMQMLKFKVGNKPGLELVLNIDPKIPEILKGDPVRLNQIVLNLCDNAVKFTQLGEVRVDIQLLKDDEDKVKLAFLISDTGKGIRKDKLSSVFNRFEQVDIDTTRKYGGSGLGLSITKQLVELQGGDITVKSKLNVGTTFTVKLEFLKSVSAEEIDLKVETEISKLDGLNMLVVDDNSLNKEILVDLLKDINDKIKIDLADDGKMAVKMLSDQLYDIVLMDIQMPRMNGYQASKHIRNEMNGPVSKIPIIAMTAHALSEASSKCIEAGMNDFISKPIDTQKLIEKIFETLDLGKVAAANGKTYSHNEFDTIDLTYLNEITRGDKKKVTKYIDIFLNNIPFDMEKMKKSLDEKDYQELGAVAHKMKGNINCMGIKELQPIFASAENYKSEDLSYDELIEIVETIDNVCSKAIIELEEVKKQL
jgi:signal transduction histidine kinase/CheY-like chemotaxis protein/HPt (histidine-containing phosphotransfer) domain-containing protein